MRNQRSYYIDIDLIEKSHSYYIDIDLTFKLDCSSAVALNKIPQLIYFSSLISEPFVLN